MLDNVERELVDVPSPSAEVTGNNIKWVAHHRWEHSSTESFPARPIFKE